MNELRREPLLGRWVAVLGNSMRPEEYNFPVESPSGGLCFLCPGEEGQTPDIYTAVDESGRWTVKVIPAAMGIFTLEGELGRRGVGMYDSMNSIGVNEIVVESPLHDAPPEDGGAEHMERILDAYLARINELERDNRIRYIMIHKNCGASSGDTCGHPHSLITATPVIPKRVKDELDGAKQYYEYKERCIFCDIIRDELRFKERVIMESDSFLVFSPYAARFPFEFWIIPRIHNCSFKDISGDEKRDLSVILFKMTGRLRRLLNDPPYNHVLHTAPIRIPRRNHWHTLGEDFHWHMEFMPRVRRLTGFELGSGMYTLSTSPEDAAKYLKEV